MPDNDFDAIDAAQMLSQPIRQIDRAVLAAGAAEGNHQVREAALPIVGDAGIDKRDSLGKKLVHAFLPVEIVDDRCVLPVRDRNCSWRPGLGRLRASKTNPPPLPASSAGMGWWKEKLKMRTVKPGAGAAWSFNFSDDDILSSASSSAGKAMGSLTLSASQRRFLSA